MSFFAGLKFNKSIRGFYRSWQRYLQSREDNERVNPLNLPGWLFFQSKSRVIDLLSDYYFEKKPTIMIDGGLGSQMIGWIKYQIAREMFFDKEIQLDLSYFLSEQTEDLVPGLTKWEWELDHYGLKLMDLNPVKKPFLTDISYEKRAQFEFPFFQVMAGRSWEHLFPLSTTATQLCRTLELPIEFGILHLRRGDYLKVGSKIVHETEVSELLAKIAELLPQTLLVISDSEISDLGLNRIREAAKVRDIKKIIGGDMHAVHGLMRQSKVLIASNSTYSISAALTMTNGGTTIFPANLYGPAMPNLNRNFNTLADWHFRG